MQRPFSIAHRDDQADGHRRSQQSLGFTLIEVMIVVAIIAILAAIAYPAYTSHIVKTRRVAAEGCMSELASYMERYYTTNLAYDKDSDGTANVLPELDCRGASQTGDHYTYELTTEASEYEIKAVPQGGQKTRDTACATLSLSQTGERKISGDGEIATCW